MAGNTSAAFYRAYVFFEKMRVKEKKPKSQHRLGMEDAWDECEPYGKSTPGLDVRMLLDRQSYIVPQGVKVDQDEFGKASTGW